MKRPFASCALLLVIAAGCGAQPPEAVDSTSEPMVTLTKVVFAPDGTYTVETESITAAEQIASLAARNAPAPAPSQDGLGTAAQAITRDTLCTGSDNEYWDDFTGHGGNEICFSGTGTADLSQFCKAGGGPPCGTGGDWTASIKSYYSQAQIGHVKNTTGSDGCADFGITSVQTDTSFTPMANYLTQGSYCCPTGKSWCACGACPGQSLCLSTLSQCQNWCNTCF